MTLRVTLEVVPRGDETRKYSIGRLDISNVMQTDLDEYDYRVHQWSDGETFLKEVFVSHTRKDGAYTLVAKAIAALFNKEQNDAKSG